jgi:hypothetical protein
VRIDLKELKTFSQCPALYYFSKRKKQPAPFRVVAAERIIKKCLLQAEQTGYRANWRQVVGMVDTAVFKNVDVEDPEQFKHAKQLSEWILKGIQKWYKKIYLQEAHTTYVDIDLTRQVQGHTVVGRAPVVQVREVPSVTLIKNVGMDVAGMYNDLELRGLSALLSDSVGGSDVYIRNIFVGPLGGFETCSTMISESVNKRALGVLEQVVEVMAKGISYPSITKYCKECQFQRRCVL